MNQENVEFNLSVNNQSEQEIINANNYTVENIQNYQVQFYENEEEQIKKSIKSFVKSNTKIISYKESINGQKECIICLEDFKQNENIRILQCMHYFHKKCIDNWLIKSINCPECQYNIIPK